MQKIIDTNKIRNNLKLAIQDKLFNWIDIRNDNYGIGLNILTDIFKYDSIGLYTDSLSDALKIRNINKNIPIILTRINNTEQIYDLIINDITIVIDDLELFYEINKLKIKDELSICLKINIDNFEDGLSIKAFNIIEDAINENKKISIRSIFCETNDDNNELTKFINLIDKTNYSSFIINESHPKTTDGFITKKIYENTLNYVATIDNCYEIKKKNIIMGKKIKKDGYMLKLNISTLNIENIKYICIENKKYKILKYDGDRIFLFGENPIKIGKKIDVTPYIYQISSKKWPKFYTLNGKNADFNDFD